MNYFYVQSFNVVDFLISHIPTKFEFNCTFFLVNKLLLISEA